MGDLILAIAVFVAAHVIPAAPALRRRLVGALGLPVYLTAYSILSLGLLAWVWIVWQDAPAILLWPMWPQTMWAPVLIMPVACVLLVAGMTTPNPFSLGPGAKAYDPEHPGILRLTRHPALWALILWAGAHMMPNGDVAALMVFGVFLILAAAGPKLLELKRRKTLGDDWVRLTAHTRRPTLAMIGEVGAVRVLAGLALYAGLLWAHPIVFGVSPLP